MLVLHYLLLIAQFGAVQQNPEATDWADLSYLSTTAREANVELIRRDELDWVDVTTDDVLFVVNPNGLSVWQNLVRFLEHGGRAIISLDRGLPPGDLLERLGLRLAEEAPAHGQYYERHPAFPLLKRPVDASEDFLWFNVSEVVCNHSTYLSRVPGSLNRTTPKMTFDDANQWLVAEAKFGEGQALVVADSSILINDMQRHIYGNKQFAANLLRYFCDHGDTCEVHFIDEQVAHRGVWEARIPAGVRGVEYLFERGTRAFDELISTLDVRLLGASASMWSLVVPFMVLVICVGGVWRGTIYRSAVRQKMVQMNASHSNYWVAALSSARDHANFAIPAGILLRELQRDLAMRGIVFTEAGHLDEDPSMVVDRHFGQVPQTVRLAALRCFSALSNLPASDDLALAGHMSHEEFENLWNQSQILKCHLQSGA